MKKKTSSLVLILLILVSIFSIGFATWIISFDQNFDANYNPQTDVNINNLYNQKLTYNGQNQTVNTKILGDIINDYSLVITKDDIEVSEVKDAGLYIFSYTSTKENLQPFNINLTIEPINVDVTFTVTYNGKSQEYVNIYDIHHYDTFIADNTKKVNITAKITGILANDIVNVDFKEGTLPVNDFDFGVQKSFNLSLSGEHSHNYRLNNNSVNVVARQKLILKNQPLEKNYDGTLANDAINTVKDLIKNNLYLDDGKTQFTNAIATYVNYMHNGTYLYGSVPQDLGFTPQVCESKKMIGSTYIVNFFFADPKFEVFKEGNSKPIQLREEVNVHFKYKTAKIGNSYYTIEDAIISGSGNIILEGDATNDTSFVVTSFSNILDNNIYDINGRRILLPYDTNYKDDYIVTSTGTLGSDNKDQLNYINVFAGLYIPEKITLNLNNGANIAVGSIIRAFGSIARRSVVINDGIINVNINSKLLSYGYTKGKGIINVHSSGEVIDVFKINDWPGADEALGLKNKNAFPVLNWSVSNISCSTKVFKEGMYNAMTYVIALNGGIRIEAKDIYIIGNSNSPNCLFKPNGGSSDDYVLKDVFINNDKFTVNNQSNYKSEFIIKGKYKDAKLKINAKSYSFETSTSIAIPISNFDFTIETNSNLLLSSSSYILYQNSSILIKNNANLEINGSAYLYSLNNTKIIVNGNLTGTGSVSNIDVTNQKTNGSPIITNTENAIIDIANFNVASCIIKASEKTVITINGNTNGMIDSPDQIANFNNGNAYVSTGSNPYYFIPLSSTNHFNVDMVVDGVTTRKTYNKLDNNFTIDSSSIDTPSKKYYDFEGWYLDSNYSNPFNSHTFTTSDETITLYAKFKIHEYKIIYNFGYNDQIIEDLSSISGNKDTITFTFDGTTFTYWTDVNNKKTSNTIPLPSGFTYTLEDGSIKMEEEGWHVGIVSVQITDERINELTASQFELYDSQFGNTDLYLSKLFVDHTITIVGKNGVSTTFGVMNGTNLNTLGSNNIIRIFANKLNESITEYQYTGFIYNGVTYKLNEPETWDILVESDIELILKENYYRNITFKVTTPATSGKDQLSAMIFINDVQIEGTYRTHLLANNETKTVRYLEETSLNIRIEGYKWIFEFKPFDWVAYSHNINYYQTGSQKVDVNATTTSFDYIVPSMDDTIIIDIAKK